MEEAVLATGACSGAACGGVGRVLGWACFMGTPASCKIGRRVGQTNTGCSGKRAEFRPGRRNREVAITAFTPCGGPALLPVEHADAKNRTHRGRGGPRASGRSCSCSLASLAGAVGRDGHLPSRPRHLRGDDPAVRGTGSPGRARHLRPARRLGRALRCGGLPARLRIEARTVESREVGRGRSGGWTWPGCGRRPATAVKSFIRALIPIGFGAALGTGALVAFALARRRPVRLGHDAGLRGGRRARGRGRNRAVLLPREAIENPDYYANGSQIPVALRVAQQATDSAQAISQDLDDQLLGLARLISVPRGRPLGAAAARLDRGVGPPQQPARAARPGAGGSGEPLMFAGDLTTSGVPLEADLTREVTQRGPPVRVRLRQPRLGHAQAAPGAVGRSRAHRARVAPTRRRRRPGVGEGRGPPRRRLRRSVQAAPCEGYRARTATEITASQKAATGPGCARRRPGRHRDGPCSHAGRDRPHGATADPPTAPLLLLTGHTHEQELDDLGNRSWW